MLIRSVLPTGPTESLAVLGSSTDAHAAWLSLSASRPAWTLWGKAMPEEGTVCPAHPLLCHMVDVAAVAAWMLAKTIPRALADRLLTLPGLTREQSFRFLLFVIALHDLGKATPPFQTYVAWAREQLPLLGFDVEPKDKAHHSELGVALGEVVLADKGVPFPADRRFMRAVAAHHGEFPTDCKAREGLKQWHPSLLGQRPAWAAARVAIVDELRVLFQVDAFPTQDVDHAYLLLLAGLTSVADWVGSMTEHFPYVPPQPSLSNYFAHALQRAEGALESVGMRAAPARPARSFIELFPGYTPWPLHEAAERVASGITGPTLVIVEAPMGEGKTEASLLLAQAAAAHTGADGIYVGLPTQATSNQMFKRVLAYLERTRPNEPQGLLLAHGEASLVEAFESIKVRGIYGENFEKSRGEGSIRAEGWFLQKKRGLLVTNAVGTIDQALLSVLRIPHGFVRSFGLAGKTVILDEVHAYDTYTGTLLDELLGWLGAMGTSVILLSATLPTSRRASFVSHYLEGAGHSAAAPPAALPYPRITVAGPAGTHMETFTPRSVGVDIALRARSPEIGDAAREILAAVESGGCAGWILNTVARAQDAFTAVRALAPDVPVLLIHARLLPTVRLEREERLATWLGPKSAERPTRCIVIGTQVLEQSLDVDFDVLFTDLAPIDLLLQRAGRLWRHQRTDRSPAQHHPRFVILRPEDAADRKALDAIAIMYPDILLKLTLSALEGRASLRIPDEIEGLVGRVYDDGLVSGSASLFPESLREDFLDHAGRSRAEASAAEQRVIPPPYSVDDIFHDLGVFLEDDEDPALNPQLQAVTRLGEPSIDIVCLERQAGVLVVGDVEDTPLDLDVLPSMALMKRLVRRSIGVSRPSVVRALLATDCPEGWKKSSVLRYRRPVIFENGQAEVGGSVLRLDPDLGLVFT